MWATNAKIVGIVLGTLALYTLIANEIPQVQSEVPQTLTLGANVTPEQLVAAGEKVFNGIGGCPTCHGLGTRAPNLLTDEKGQGPIGARCGKREPGKTCKQYLYESLDQPGAYVVEGYQPIMPVMTKQLSPEQVWAVIALLEALGGTVDVTAYDMTAHTCNLQHLHNLSNGGWGWWRRCWGFGRGVHRPESHHPGRGVPRLSQAGGTGPGDRARSHARRLAARRGVDPQEDPRPGLVCDEGLREARGDHAQELRHHDERRAARSAGTVPGGAQMSPSLPPAIRRYAEHPFWQAVGILVLAYIVVVWVVPVLPGSAIVPKSVVLQYMITVLVGVLIYVSDNEERWRRFQEPIRAVLVEPRLKLVRAVVLAGVTALVGVVAYGRVTTTVAAPPNLRSIHPAPPAEVTFRGKTITLTGLENPLRQHPDSLSAYLAEGKHVYYRNCLPCHGDHLDGQGHFASGFNPLPANFQDNGTIAQLTESFVFWRVAKGGPGLPREGTPWNSAMPVWEDFLTEREIWSVILFLYEQTGWKPRTWEKTEGAGSGQAGSSHD